MSLLEIIKEQSHIGFSGRINLLIGNERRYAGHILMNNGVTVSCRFEKAVGKPALMMAISFDLRSDKLKKVSEPEVVSDDMKMMLLTANEIVQDAQEYLRKTIRLKKVGFPKNAIFSIDREKLFKSEDKLLSDEYNLASLMWDFKSFSDIIKKTDMEPERIYISLLGLKEKRVLRVKRGSEE